MWEAKISNPFKAIGKVFRKVIHSTVGKIIIGALMVGAVVLTAGAALGALPAIGTVLGSVGISGTMASILGGAISMGAVGAVTGGIGGLISGKGFFSGAETGFLAGAAAGGIAGGVGLVGANGVFGSLGQGAAQTAVNTGATTASPLAASASQVGAAVPTSVTTSATTSAAATGAAQAAGHSALGGLLGSGGIGPVLQAGGSIISGFASGKATEAQLQAEQQMSRDKYDRIAYNYGYRNVYGDPHSNVPTSQEQVYAMQNPQFLTPSYDPNAGLLRTQPSQFIQPSYQYQIVNGQVVPVPVPAG
jgi:hypothetical protein